MTTRTISDATEAMAVLRAAGQQIPSLPPGINHLTVPVVTAEGQPAIAIVSRSGLQLVICVDHPPPANASEKLSLAAMKIIAS